MSEMSNAPGITEGTAAVDISSVTPLRTLKAALAFANLGQPVFPVRSHGEKAKAPLVDHWRDEATTDERTIILWWEHYRNAAIGIPTGSVCGLWSVLDIDNKPDGHGYDSAALLARCGLLRGAVMLVSTPSGGQHLYFPASEHGNASLPQHRIDFRGVGGYVVGPPSVMDAGAYLMTQRREGGEQIDWTACRDLLSPPQRKAYRASGGSLDRLSQHVAQAQAGGRNGALYWAACRAVEAGQDPAGLVAAGVAAGLPEWEATRTVQSAAQAGGAA